MEKLRFKFNCIEDLIAYANKEPSPKNKYNKKEYIQENQYSAQSWFGADSLEKALGFMRSGWLEGLIRLDEIEDRIKNENPLFVTPSKRKVKRKKFSTEGDELDMSKVYEGNFETCWQGTEPKITDGAGKFVRIYSNITFNCRTDSSTHFYTGVTCTILTDILEEAGYRVEIIGYSHAVNVFTDKTGVYIETVYKHHDMPLDKERICMATGLAAMQRICTFYLYYTIDKATAYGLGNPVEKPLDVKDSIIIQEVESEEECVKIINDTLAKFNLE